MSATTRIQSLLGAAIGCGLLFGSPLSAQELLYSITQASPSASSLSQRQGSPTVSFQSTDGSQLVVGEQVQVALPDGGVSVGTVTLEHSETPLNALTMAPTSGTKVIALEPGKSLDIHINADAIVGMTFSDYRQQKFYRSVLDENGSGVLAEEDNGQYVCAHFPVHNDSAQAAAEIDLADAPSLATVMNLQSRPGATNVLYIDYWGGSLSASAWSSGTINYDAYSLDSSSAFSSTERYYMYQAWAETAEDYAPFDVNVTTRASVFAATGNSNKSRIIATTDATRDSYGLCNNCGGVAYVGTYGGSVLYQTGWTFNSDLTSMGMTHSHEAGHQMGLLHDGISSLSYYSGHGDWGPVMGAPFGKRYVQWSKGEYPNANLFEDDFQIIHNKLGTLDDDVGDTVVQAEVLGSSTDIIRNIKPAGAVGNPDNDYDYFKFTVGSTGGTVDIEIAPQLGLDMMQNAGGEDRAANLAIEAIFWKAGVTELIEDIQPGDNVPLRPNTNKLTYAGELTGGTYNLRVHNRSPDSDWSTGFGEWGHGGNYRLKLTVNNNPSQLCNGKVVTVDLENGDVPSSGNDVILGTNGADVINGGAGYDIICGLDGDDIINGGSGSDWIDGGDGDDTINGGDGNDKIYGGRDSDVMHGDDGNDRLYGQGARDIIYGDDGDDKIYGGQNNDDLFGGNGNDRIWGETGNDLVLGGNGDDSWLDGGDHNDRVSGQGGNDIVRGGDGADEVYGGPGNDDVRAQAGNDRVTDGGQGIDSCQVAPGIDAVSVRCE